MKLFYLGMDVSKEKLDLCLMRDSKVIEEFVVKHEIQSIQKEISVLTGHYAIELDGLLLCAEYRRPVYLSSVLCMRGTRSGFMAGESSPDQISFRSSARQERPLGCSKDSFL
ncbi:hypothetical protein EZS27_035784, partial [termite gut metagenome]